MSDGSWFQKGYGGIKPEEERLRTMYGPNRFWMPAGEKKTVVFIDDEPACVHEHNPKMNGSWKNWTTCIRDIHPDDPSCCELLAEPGYNRYYVGYYTIVDCTQWTDKRGNVYQFELKLYGAKLKTLNLLKTKRAEDWGGRMAGKVMNIRRTSSDDASVGNDFTMDRDADMEKLWAKATYKGKKIGDLFTEATEDEEARVELMRLFDFKKGEGGLLVPDVPAFNYFQVLQPKKPQEMRTFLKAGKIEESDNSRFNSSNSKSATTDGGAADEAVPF